MFVVLKTIHPEPYGSTCKRELKPVMPRFVLKAGIGRTSNLGLPNGASDGILMMLRSEKTSPLMCCIVQSPRRKQDTDNEDHNLEQEHI